MIIIRLLFFEFPTFDGEDLPGTIETMVRCVIFMIVVIYLLSLVLLFL